MQWTGESRILKTLGTLFNRAKEKREWLIYLSVLVASALIQFYFNNSFYGVVLIILGILILVIRSRPVNLILVWEACLILIFFATPSAITWVGLIFSSKHAVQNFAQVQSNLETPNTGRQVLPTAVQQISVLLQAQQLSNYQLSPRLQEPQFFQRIIEATWPIKLERQSDYYLYFRDEPQAETPCREIDRSEEIVLVYCH